MSQIPESYPWKPVNSLDQLFTQAYCIQPILNKKVWAWTSESGGKFLIRPKRKVEEHVDKNLIPQIQNSMKQISRGISYASGSWSSFKRQFQMSVSNPSIMDKNCGQKDIENAIEQQDSIEQVNNHTDHRSNDNCREDLNDLVLEKSRTNILKIKDCEPRSSAGPCSDIFTETSLSTQKVVDIEDCLVEGKLVGEQVLDQTQFLSAAEIISNEKNGIYLPIRQGTVKTTCRAIEKMVRTYGQARANKQGT